MVDKKGRVLVTGVTGFIGSHTAIQLLNDGYPVRGSLRSMKRADEIRDVIAKHASVNELDFVEADLNDANVWDEAVSGCVHVQHIASPFPTVMPKDADELIVPARDGALNVLAAARRSGIQRVVMTSSAASIAYGHDEENRTFTEEDWTDTADIKRIGPYVASKAIAERAAWEFVNGEGEGMELVTITPPYVFGPVLEKDLGSSNQAIKKALDGELPGVPRLPMNVVDVRDVALAHIRAMTNPDAAGERFITCAGFAWYSDVIDILRRGVPSYAKELPKFTIPNLAVRAFSLVDAETRSILLDLGKEKTYDASKAEKTLGMNWRSIEETVLDTANSLIEQGLV